MEFLNTYPEQRPIQLVRRDWEDETLPNDVETFSFTSELKGYKSSGETPGSPEFAVLSGLDFSVSREKLASVQASRGDIIRIEKLTSDPCYRGDGIVKVVNETKKISATIKDWMENRSKEWEELRKAANNA